MKFVQIKNKIFQKNNKLEQCTKEFFLYKTKDFSQNKKNQDLKFLSKHEFSR